MAMNKKRQAIWDKSNGHCWYCGCELGERGWHADHFEPIVRKWDDGTCKHPERDNEDNKVPACASFNDIEPDKAKIDELRSVVSSIKSS